VAVILTMSACFSIQNTAGTPRSYGVIAHPSASSQPLGDYQILPKLPKVKIRYDCESGKVRFIS
jgi:hypothetical protein